MDYRVAIVGCGKMGKALAYFFAMFNFSEIYIADICHEREVECKNFVISKFPELNIKYGLGSCTYDIVILALSGPSTEMFLKENVKKINFKNKRIFISLGRPNYGSQKQHEEFKTWLIENDIRLLYGLGLEPGLAEMIANYMLYKHDIQAINTMKIYCGGVPKKAKYPLYFDLLYNAEIPTSPRVVFRKKNNQLVTYDRLEHHNSVLIENIGVFDAYDDGLSPFFLCGEKVSSIQNISQQTIRWPGFVNTINTLRSCGFFSNDKIADVNMTANDITHAILKHNNILGTGASDITILHIELYLNNQKIHKISVTSEYDDDYCLTGMAKLTAFPTVFIAKTILQEGKNYAAGVLFSFELFTDREIEMLKTNLLQYKIGVIREWSE